MKYSFKKRWDENTNIDWWKESRIQLNKIIDEYNYWQIDGFNIERGMDVLAKIKHGKETIGSQDGGSGYMEELEEMEKSIKDCIANYLK